MDVIDEDGDLFGTVNVVDALAGLLVLSVVIAGVVIVNPFATSEQATRYATVDLGSQPDYVASQISAGDRLPEDARGNLTVRDVYYSPGENGDVHVIARVELEGRLTFSPDRFTYADEPLLQGNNLTIRTPDYEVTGTVARLDRNRSTLRTGSTPVRLTATVPENVAETIATGDTFTVADRRVATVESVRIAQAGNGTTRHLTIGASLRTFTDGGRRWFATRPVTLGSSLPFRTAEYSLTATVSRLGSAGLNTSSTDVLLESTVPTTTAESIAVGDTFRVGGQEVATVESVRVFPTGNPAEKHVLVGVPLETVTADGVPTFAGRPVKLGRTIPLSTNAYGVDGNVVRVGSQAPPGEVTRRTVRVKLSDVPPEIADGVTQDMSETRGGTTFATIQSVQSENATVVLRSETGDIYRRQHPVNQDVYLTVTMRTRETGTGLTFHGRSLQEGTSVVLDLQRITVQGTVIDIQS